MEVPSTSISGKQDQESYLEKLGLGGFYSLEECNRYLVIRKQKIGVREIIGELLKFIERACQQKGGPLPVSDPRISVVCNVLDTFLSRLKELPFDNMDWQPLDAYFYDEVTYWNLLDGDADNIASRLARGEPNWHTPTDGRTSYLLGPGWVRKRRNNRRARARAKTRKALVAGRNLDTRDKTQKPDKEFKLKLPDRPKGPTEEWKCERCGYCLFGCCCYELCNIFDLRRD